MWSSKIGIALILNLCLLWIPAFAEENSNEIFTIIKVPRITPLPEPINDNYFRITFLYSNISEKIENSFWNKIRSVFVDSNKKTVFQIQQKINPGSNSEIISSKVISIFDKNSDFISSHYAYNQALISYKLFQDADKITVRASLSEITVEGASALRKILDKLNELPLVTSFTAGGLTVAAKVIDVMTGMTANSGNKSKSASYSIQGASQLASLEYIAIVATDEAAKFALLATDPSKIPKTLEEMDANGRHNYPSFVLLKIEHDDAIYDPQQILSAKSEVRKLIENELSAIKNAASNKDKAEKCLELRSSLRFLGPLTSKDESYAVMAALADSGFDPDRTHWHLRTNCLNNDDIDAARKKYSTFRFGTCQDTACRTASRFTNAWLLNEDSGTTAGTINWLAALGGKKIEQGSGSEADFRKLFTLGTRYGNYEPTSNNSISAKGTLFDTVNREDCVYDILATLHLKKVNGVNKVKRVTIKETKQLIDGQHPSHSWTETGTKNCKELLKPSGP
jgi:hypothetical protein